MSHYLSKEERKKLELIQYKKALQSKLDECFDPNDLNSRPTGLQIEALRDDKHRVIFIVAANRCLAKGTMVSTPQGPVKIEDLAVGDYVYDENGNPARVGQVFDQGIQEVIDLHNLDDGEVVATCTNHHVWLCESDDGEVDELTTEELLSYSSYGIFKFDDQKVCVEAENKRLEHCYDIHVETPTNLYLLANGLVTHNSGKTQTVTRQASWWLQNKHPYIPARKEWGDKFNILVVGRTTTILTEELWENKISKFLEPSSFRVKRGSSGVETVTDLNTGNKLIFMSHHDAKNAREKVQGFTSPIVILDEMPDDPSLVTELIMRTITNNGIFIAAFTPLVENEGIRKIVDDKSNPNQIRYTFRPEDNPHIIRTFGSIDEYDKEIKSKCASEAEYRARRFGEWYYSSGRVVRAFEPETHKRPLPKGYSNYGWRHVMVVDPAASGLAGISIWAEDPNSLAWYNVYAKKEQGDAAYDLVKTIESIAANFNVVERWCDCNPAGFYREAHRQGVKYFSISDKMDRKAITIDKLNEYIATGRIYLTPASEELEEEFLNCKWKENTSDKIVHSSKWHLIDTARYFVDKMPKPLREPVQYDTMRQAIKQEYTKQEQKKTELAQQQKQKLMRIKQRRSKFNNPRRRAR